MTLPPYRRTLHGAGEEVEHRTDGAHMAVDIEFVPMRVSPLLLLRRRHAYPQQVGVSRIYRLHNRLVVLIRELRLVRRRVGNDLQVRIHLRSPLHNQIEHLLRAAHEHYRELTLTEF